MLRKLALLLTVTFVLGTLPAGGALPFEVDGQPLPSLAPMLERVTPAVVNISTRKALRTDQHPLLRDPFFRRFFERPNNMRERRNQSLGSGVIVDAALGHVLTNHHVIAQADEIKVTLYDGRELKADLLGSDPETDVALLQIPARELTAVPLSDSSTLRVGDFVVAIGNPFGLSQTVTSGIVSALGRSGLGIEGYEDFIQTDASINPGNSGGPLVNLRGELVGINTAILAPNGSSVGIGFAIPSNMAQAIQRQIAEHGGVQRGIFGVTVQDLTPDLARALDAPPKTRGAVVNSVQADSAAEQAGLRAGDLIVRLNAQPIRSAADLNTQFALLRVGDRVTVEVLREGRTKKLRVKIADPYADYVNGGPIHRQFRGALLGEVVDKSGFGNNPGIAIGPVDDDSNAWRSGLREGDVLFQVNRKRIKTLAQLRAASVRGIRQLRLRRGDRLVTLVSR